MALDKVLKIYDENGNPVDYDILASDVKFLPDGKDLPTKLTEMEDAIEDAAQTGGDGTVTGVKVGNTPYNPDGQGVVDLSVPFADKATKTELQNAINSLQSALDTLIGSGNVQGAIDTFNEVKAFLEGIDTDDPTLFNQLKSLSDAITALQITLSQKANDNAVVKSISVNGTAQAKDTNGNVNVSVPTLTLDDAPTAGSNNAVKSGGIKTALDAKANAADVPTKTEMSDAIDDALGEAQVTVVPSGSVGVIASLGSDSDEDALSASMGKKLKVAVLTILNSLGNYAFPNGKPTIDWGGSSTVTYTVTYPNDAKVTHTGAGDTVELGSSLEVTLGTNDDLYVIKDSSVMVYMGGVEQSGAYNATTQKVTLAAVTGNVVIVAEAMTYVQSGLVLHLDCRHRGGTGTEVSGHWKSLVNYGQSPIDFTLGSAVVAADTGMVFDGSANSYAETDTALNVPATDGTIEVVATIVDSESNNHTNTVLVNPIENAIGFCIYNAAADSGHKTATIMMGRSGSNYSSVAAHWSGRVGDTTTDFAIAVTTGTPNGVGHNKGTELTLNTRYHLVVDATAHNKLMIGRSKRSGGDRLLVGTIRSIRVYSGHLSADQQRTNWLIDKKRFNL